MFNVPLLAKGALMVAVLPLSVFRFFPRHPRPTRILNVTVTFKMTGIVVVK
jgi:hypothetical protein